MALIDDFRAARIKRRLAHRDTNAEVDTLAAQVVTQVADALFARARPVAAFSWASDDALHNASRAFARALVDEATREADDTDPAVVP